MKKLEKDDEFGAFNSGKNSLKINDIHTITISYRDPGDAIGFSRIATNDYKNKEDAEQINKMIKDVDIEEQCLSIFGDNVFYQLDEHHNIIKTEKNIQTNLGYGDISIKAVYKKATSKSSENVVFDISIEPVWIKDDEKIPFSLLKLKIKKP